MMVDMIWGKKMALVIVDPQRKFSLKVPDWDERMGSAVEGMNRFSRIFRRYGAPVILVRFEGASHCSYEGDDGDDWLPGLETSPSDIVVSKRNMSCFKETDLLKVMQENGIDCALYTGMLTEFCVISTYYASSERGVVPYIGKGATIAYNSNGNEAAQVVCSTVDEKTVERLLSGEQPEPVMPFE
ncbi:MAG: cysteine hydrolase [Candidatus Methanomethylophilaceae archaeon]|jgi:nicotinamidase-related amidase|nr:cysteine hydrolase [Candidatus Methanomethylophilaceae archaeon]